MDTNPTGEMPTGESRMLSDSRSPHKLMLTRQVLRSVASNLSKPS